MRIAKESNMDAHKIDWSAIPWTPVRQGVERIAAITRDLRALGRPDEAREADHGVADDGVAAV